VLQASVGSFSLSLSTANLIFSRKSKCRSTAQTNIYRSLQLKQSFDSKIHAEINLKTIREIGFNASNPKKVPKVLMALCPYTRSSTELC
jgi:hypothetical protein